MPVSRLRDIPGIGVDEVGDAADAANDPRFLRLENLDTDIPPPAIGRRVTHEAVEQDAANSYLPFQGHWELRQAAAAHVARATVEPGQEVVLFDPIYGGLVNRIRLAGGIPRHVPSRPTARGWVTDADELAAAIGRNTAAVLLMGPAMPTGALLTNEHLTAIAEPVNRHGAWIIYDAAMERIRFDAQPPLHPASHPALTERTITVGSASKELRMIGWRVGWVVGPAPIIVDVGLVGLTNVVCQVGIAQQAVAAALSAADADQDVAAAVATWQQRCDTIFDQLSGYPCVRPDGGWSLLLDTTALGLSPAEASQRLFNRSQVAATPVSGWGPSGDRHLRLVYANETVERLTDLRSRFDVAFG
jgi:aspartate/methionine/tyrosine aminotransferase